MLTSVALSCVFSWTSSKPVFRHTVPYIILAAHIVLCASYGKKFTMSLVLEVFVDVNKHLFTFVSCCPPQFSFYIHYAFECQQVCISLFSIRLDVFSNVFVYSFWNLTTLYIVFQFTCFFIFVLVSSLIILFILFKHKV